MVMIYIRLEHFPKEAYKELDPKNASPYKIVKKINSNTNTLELPKEMGTTNVFNNENLTF